MDMGGMSGIGPGLMSPFAGFAGLGIGMALSMVAMTVLRSAGARKGRGEAWTTPGVIGGVILLAGAGAALSALGTFFGMMGILFAVFFLVGGFTAFSGAAQSEQRRREAMDLARELNRTAYQGQPPVPPASGTAAPRGTTLNGEPLPDSGQGTGGRREPDWYQYGTEGAEGGRPSS